MGWEWISSLKDLTNNEKISIHPSYRDAYDKPRKRITEENYDFRYRNKDVYSNKRVGQYNELVKVEEAEQIQFDVDQVSAWFNFTSELATRVYEDDWDTNSWDTLQIFNPFTQRSLTPPTRNHGGGVRWIRSTHIVRLFFVNWV